MATKWKNQNKIPGLWPVSSEMTYMIHKSLHIDGMQTASYKHTYHQIIKHRSKFKLSNHTHNITDINLRTHIIDIYILGNEIGFHLHRRIFILLPANRMNFTVIHYIPPRICHRSWVGFSSPTKQTPSEEHRN